MDNHRAVGTYELFGNERRILHKEIISVSTPSHGQCHSNCISEQDGRQPFLLFIRSGQGSLDVVHQKESNHSCRAPIRVREYPCRLRDPTPYRFQRLEITFLSLDKKLGQFSMDLFASRTNTQLPLYCRWRLDPTALAVDALSISWGSHHPYMLLPFALIPRCLTKLHKRENISDDYNSWLAQSILVPTITEQSGGHSNRLITNPRYCDESHRTESPISNTGPSSTSRMASFRRSIHAGGLSE